MVSGWEQSELGTLGVKSFPRCNNVHFSLAQKFHCEQGSVVLNKERNEMDVALPSSLTLA